MFHESHRTIRNCPVAVVGGAGFLGSHLVNHLIDDRGCDVLVVDNLVAGRREFVHAKATFCHHDITGSEDFLRYRFVDHKTQFVFNYAAYPYVPDSYARPLHVFNVNAAGALKVINAAQEAGCKGILQVSSAELYGETGSRKRRPDPKKDVCGPSDFTDGRIRETDEVAPHSTYGAAKAAIDALIQVRFKEAQTPVIALRQFNCIGERETHPYVVPEIISQLAKQKAFDLPEQGKTVPLEICNGLVRLGNNSFRDFLYAGDAVMIAVELLERGQFGEVYNLGSESGVKIYDLAKLVGKLMGFSDVLVEVDEARIRPWEIWHLQSDNTKIKAALRVPIAEEPMTEPGPATLPPSRFIPLEEALRRTIRWYREAGRWPWEK